ncbi:ZIP family metal transporter [Halarchaeum nitratireducens]|uniref:ZIP family metal transporter n=1 Tax=Halarchaeum nitratireducens TaxID=489913 RepID=A0A830G9K6_9EURY|nr:MULTISPECIES: ZIP family metal transporter [Halarchaeum]MBP2250326.1 ZIP family zinc transporter [Halarchaeum solikamskense]GGN12707.1 ZIP family metal transporter [Halarchaeum nitratireducens]
MSAFADAFVGVAGSNPIVQAFVGGLVIAALNLVGALGIIVWRDPSERALDGALGFAAGVMLAASFTSLILPGIDAGGLVPVLVGLVLGVLLLDRADRWVPHVHVLVTGGTRADAAKRDTGDATDPEASSDDPGLDVDGRVASVLLFIVAITLHNMPEGLAVGVGFGTGNLGEALPLMLAIGIQNVPEGLAVAIAARNAGLGTRFYAMITGLRAGLVEVPVAVFGAWAVLVATPVLPYAMGFAAGAMLYVISDEIIPESHARGYERTATLGTMAGLMVMLTLDVALAA